MTRTDTGWRYTHQLLKEKELGRPLAYNEGVQFRDRDPRNLALNNLVLTTIVRQRQAKRTAKAQSVNDASLEERIADLEARVTEIEAKLREAMNLAV
jgi:hypothetical protein